MPPPTTTIGGLHSFFPLPSSTAPPRRPTSPSSSSSAAAASHPHHQLSVPGISLLSEWRSFKATAAAAMEERKGIVELRDRLDRTLASRDLADESSLRSLVKKQILESSLSGSDEGNIDVIAEARAKEVANFLEMLNTSGNERSSNGAPQKEWKVKQDTDQLRVMYREGPEGTPFHTLLAEGFADGPIDVCTCVSWESGLYRKWFPQYNLPTFKVAQSGCLKKIRIGEEISLIRKGEGSMAGFRERSSSTLL